MLRTALLAATLVAAIAVSAAPAAGDPLTGAWVAHDLAGDGSTDVYLISASNRVGVRSFTLFDTYGTFCETDGPGTGSVLIAKGTATLDGAIVKFAYDWWWCANGRRGTFDPPLTGHATLTGDGLDFGGGYIAKRAGR